MLWAGKWLIGRLRSPQQCIAVGVAFILPNMYRAEALLAPGNDESGAGLPALASQYSGIAKLTGISLKSQNGIDRITLGIEVLKSRRFIWDFVQRRDLLVELIAAKDWDEDSRELALDSDVYDLETKRWTLGASGLSGGDPSILDVHEKFMKIMSIRRDRDTGLIELSVVHYSPDVARNWVQWLVEDLNSTMMNKDITAAQQAIDYLNGQIHSTSIAELRGVFFGLIEEQTKKIMLAKGSTEYLFQTIDPAIAPDKKYKPQRSVILMLGFVLGCMLGAVFVLCAE